jgi:hypothetical protein
VGASHVGGNRVWTLRRHSRAAPDRPRNPLLPICVEGEFSGRLHSSQLQFDDGREGPHTADANDRHDKKACDNTSSTEETMRRRLTYALSAVALSTALAAGTLQIASVHVAAAQTGELRDDNPANWPMYNRSFDGARHSPLTEIIEPLQTASAFDDEDL